MPENGVKYVSREELQAIMEALNREISDIKSDLYNHGNGLLNRFNQFVVEFRTVESEKEKIRLREQEAVRAALEAKDRRDRKRSSWIMWGIGIIGTILTAIGLMVAILTYRDAQRHAQINNPAFAQPSIKSQQQAIDPTIGR